MAGDGGQSRQRADGLRRPTASLLARPWFSSVRASRRNPTDSACYANRRPSLTMPLIGDDCLKKLNDLVLSGGHDVKLPAHLGEAIVDMRT